MPITPTYPGVYVEEIPSGVRTITGVATSVTAFIGPAKQGPTDRAVLVQNFSDFDRQFGGLWVKSIMGHMVQQFFLNGGSAALIIRVVSDSATKAGTTVGGLELAASSEGDWMNGSNDNDEKQGVWVTIDNRTNPLIQDDTLFNLTVERYIPDQPPLMLEEFRNLSTNPEASRFVTTVLEQESSLIRVSDVPSGALTFSTPFEDDNNFSFSESAFSGGENGAPPSYGNYNDSSKPETGLGALDKVDIFNLLCIVPNIPGTNVADDNGGLSLLSAALKYCEKERAILIVDPATSWKKPTDVISDSPGIRTLLRSKNSAVYFPHVKSPDPLKQNRLESFPPSGVMAGIMARTDSQRGVWKAPAGTEATLSGVREFTYKLSDDENGRLNPLGVNCLRNFPVYGNVAWGARTLEGADQLASEWKYLPVRRLALFLQESLYRGTQWVVFEPNDEPLWAQIRLNIGAFMNTLFRQGAFQGATPREAYFVKCDSETTTQNDIDRGIVNILIGFAPLKPAEFVILKFQQIAGQLET